MLVALRATKRDRSCWICLMLPTEYNGEVLVELERPNCLCWARGGILIFGLCCSKSAAGEAAAVNVVVQLEVVVTARCGA